ncbi:MAG: type II 3-dehydroquinate dehydratase [Crocinitomicaceae bacterium]|nr:type II 3-dehydroquinate dehydratase [Crocinitomicaceae bacterium]
MNRIAILNGPNLNLLGTREPEVYGSKSLKELEASWVAFGELHAVEIVCFQSNVEGELVDAIQDYGFEVDAILINPGGYTHTSVAIRDAIAAVDAPVYEVHISHPDAREDFRKTSLVRPVCAGAISGLGVRGYKAVLEVLINVE